MAVLESMMDIDTIISVPIPSTITCPVGINVSRTRSICEALQNILNGNTFEVNHHILKYDEEQILQTMELLYHYPQTMFRYLQDYFVKYFDIDLYIIGVQNEKFCLIKNENNANKHMAFVIFDERNTIHGSLYKTNVDGTVQTVFNANDCAIHLDVYLYMMRLNDVDLSMDTLRIQEHQAVNCEQELRQVYPSNHRTQAHSVCNKMLEYLFCIINSLPIDSETISQTVQTFISRVHGVDYSINANAIKACKEIINSFEHFISLLKPIAWNDQIQQQQQLEPFFSNSPTTQEELRQSSSKSHVPFHVSQIDSVASTYVYMPSQYVPNTAIIYEVPVPTKLLESKIHRRTLKEFARTGSNPVQCAGSNQRDPIQVQVPPYDGKTLYLEVGVVDMTDECHLSKIVVPKGTKAANELLMNNNDLTCLDFSGCDEKTCVDFRDKRLYFTIELEEREIQQKEIRIHMIHLYQRKDINKIIAKSKQLNRCRISLRLCIYEDWKYIGVSLVWYSNIIEDHVRPNNKHTNQSSIDVNV